MPRNASQITALVLAKKHTGWVQTSSTDQFEELLVISVRGANSG